MVDFSEKRPVDSVLSVVHLGSVSLFGGSLLHEEVGVVFVDFVDLFFESLLFLLIVLPVYLPDLGLVTEVGSLNLLSGLLLLNLGIKE